MKSFLIALVVVVLADLISKGIISVSEKLFKRFNRIEG